MGYRKGDIVTARRRIEGIDVPVVPAGATGTVTTTTVFGGPKRVHFEVSDGWGRRASRCGCAAETSHRATPASVGRGGFRAGCAGTPTPCPARCVDCPPSTSRLWVHRDARPRRVPFRR